MVSAADLPVMTPIPQSGRAITTRSVVLQVWPPRRALPETRRDANGSTARTPLITLGRAQLLPAHYALSAQRRSALFCNLNRIEQLLRASVSNVYLDRGRCY